ncbi:hypothetical protein D3C76_1798360 [compost metagenome]
MLGIQILNTVELGINPILVHQLFVRTPFGDTAVLHDDNLIRMSDRGQAMGND